MAQKLDTVSAVKKQSSTVSTPPEPTTEPVTPATLPTTPEVADNYDTLFPEPGVAITAPPNWAIWLALLIVSGCAIVVGYFTFSPQLDNYLSVATPTPTQKTQITPTPTKSTEPTTTPTASPSSTPTPTPTPTASPSPTATSTAITPSSVTLRVLNGTKTAGAAASAKTTLEKAGFTVRSIGNAKNQTYTSTIIYYQPTREDEAKSVQKSLENIYSATIQQSSLANPDMVLVVIGAK